MSHHGNDSTSPNSSVSSGDSSTEDGRLRTLFDSCDHDNDGHLDRDDFIFMCSQLNMADCADEIMTQLGMTSNRLISFHEFLAYKHQVMTESNTEENGPLYQKSGAGDPGNNIGIAGLQTDRFRTDGRLLNEARLAHSFHEGQLRSGSHLGFLEHGQNCESSHAGGPRASPHKVRQNVHGHLSYPEIGQNFRESGILPGRSCNDSNDFPTGHVSNSEIAPLYSYPDSESGQNYPDKTTYTDKTEIDTGHVFTPGYPETVPRKSLSGHSLYRDSETSPHKTLPGNTGYNNMDRCHKSAPGTYPDTTSQLDTPDSGMFKQENEVMIQSDSQYGHNMSSWLTMSSDNSLGAQSGKPDSTDYDSGARDLSPEPATPQVKGHPGVTPDEGYTTVNADFTARMQMNARIKGGLGDLTNHLLHLTTDRDMLERKLNRTQEDCEDRIEQTVVRYEERITELHSVIAELRKKIERHNANVIQEEDEFEGESCKSDQESSSLGQDIDHSNSPSLDILCGAEANTDNPQRSLGEKFTDENNIYENLINNLDSSQSRSLTHLSSRNIKSPSPSTPHLPPRLPHATPQHHPTQLCHMTEQYTTTQCHVTPQNVASPHMPYSQIKELHSRPHSLEPSSQTTPSKHSPECLPPATSRPLSKMAELKKLKSPSFGENPPVDAATSHDKSSQYLTDILTQTLPECESFNDLIHLIFRCSSEISQSHVSELQLENERLVANTEHIRSQNHVTELTLEESRSQSERLSVLIGKYESNNTALQLAVGYSDHALEVYDVLCAYIEAEQGLLLANCRAAGLGAIAESSDRRNQEEITSVLQQAQTTFSTATNLARQLVHQLERSSSRCQIGPPWEDLSSNSHTNSTTSSTGSSNDTERNEKQRLRDFISQLKSDRLAVNMTVMELESVHIDPTLAPSDISDPSTADLEQAVLMQELMSSKEEKAELKAHNYLLEKEKRALELKLCGKESQEKAYVVQIEQLKSDIGERPDVPDTPQRDLNQRPTVHEHDLTESLKRERKLKHRVQELVGTMEKLSRNSETRHQQSAEFIGDLKRANSALISAFEKAKKKYQSKIKKLESHLESVTQNSHSQMSHLQQRISQLEADAHLPRMPSETSL